MSPTSKVDLERRALRASAGASLLVAGVGLWFASIAGSQAVLLDGLFNAIYFVMSLLSLKVASLIQRPDDERFPFGYAHFEPLINTTKGLLIVGVAVMAFIGAVAALATGGREVEAGPAIAYGLFAAFIGLVTAGLQRRWSRQSASPLVAADVKNWTINGLLSLVVALAFGIIFAIRGTRFAWFVPYVDPTLVAGLVTLTFAVPFKMVRDGLLEMLHAAPEPATVERVETLVAQATGHLPAHTTVVRVLRSGRTLYALVHLVLEAKSQLCVSEMDAIRREVAERIAADQPDLTVDLVFTNDIRWAQVGD